MSRVILDNRKFKDIMIGARIKELRKFLKLNQKEFSDKIGAHHSSVSEWENGKVVPKESTLIMIELRLNVNPLWLRDGNGEILLPHISDELKNLIDYLKALPKEQQIMIVKEILITTNIKKLLAK